MHINTLTITLSPQLQIDSHRDQQTMPVILIANGCCDFIAQCILLVRINHFTHSFYSPKFLFGRSTIVGSCGVQDIRVVIVTVILCNNILRSVILSSFDKPNLNYCVY